MGEFVSWNKTIKDFIFNMVCKYGTGSLVQDFCWKNNTKLCFHKRIVYPVGNLQESIPIPRNLEVNIISDNYCKSDFFFFFFFVVPVNSKQYQVANFKLT